MNGLLESVDIFNRRINHKSGHSLHLGIDPWHLDRLQPASYEMSLGPRLRVFDPHLKYLDPTNLVEYTQEVDIEGIEWYLRPGEFVLGSSMETFSFPADLAGELTGKSSIGRLGLQVHATAGFFDPGFKGTATLEISNISPVSIRLVPGLIIAQMRFVTLSRASEWPYGHPQRRSHYQGQDGPTSSRYGQAPIGQLQLPGVEWAEYERSGS